MSPSRPPSPSAWLWAEIARRFGDEAAQRLHADYCEQMRAYMLVRRFGRADEKPRER